MVKSVPSVETFNNILKKNTGTLKFLNDLRNEFNGKLTEYYEMMERRIGKLEQESLPKDWDGVYRATSK